jgi:hypothetical protein
LEFAPQTLVDRTEDVLADCEELLLFSLGNQADALFEDLLTAFTW